ncbi:metallopeptidase [Alishewanella phage vB_AspM_Slickus01]|nr:metallopeptidase [Alishewanella phage vB_AspM_Slickus01]
MKEVSRISEVRTICALAIPTLAYLLFQCDIRYGEVKTATAKIANKLPTIIINEDFWNSLKNEERAFLLYHEVMHIFLLHYGRMVDCGYDREKWNIATDYFINYVLRGYSIVNGQIVTDNRVTSYISMPKCGIFERKYVGMSADEIYQALPDDLSNTSPMDDIGNNEDSHGDGDNEQVINKMIMSAIVNASGSKSMGDTELNILIKLREIVTPKINWRDYLKSEMDKQDWMSYSYNRINKRNYGGLIFPSKIGETMRLVFGVDTSGSMGEDELQIAVGGINEIIEQYDSWEIILISCDTEAHVIGHYRSDDGDDFGSVISKDMIGGGGTSMTPLVKKANELKETMDIPQCVIYTDGFIPNIELNPECDTLILITPNGKMHTQPNFKTIRVEV